ADDLRPHRLREARPDDVDLRRLIVGGLLAAVPVLGQRDGLPAPLQNRRLLEVDPTADVAPDCRALDLALQTQDAMALVLLDRHVVLRQPPGLAAQPAVGDTGSPELLTPPVFDHDVGGPGRHAEDEQEPHRDEPCHCPPLLWRYDTVSACSPRLIRSASTSGSGRRACSRHEAWPRPRATAARWTSTRMRQSRPGASGPAIASRGVFRAGGAAS